MMRFLAVIPLSILIIGCGTCQQKVAQSRTISAGALEALAPFAPKVMPKESADRWVEMSKLIIEAAHDEAASRCPKEE